MPDFSPLAQIMPGLAKKRLASFSEPNLVGGGVLTGAPNAGADLYNYQGALGDEAFERSFQAQRAGAPSPEVDALQRLFAKTQLDRQPMQAKIGQQLAREADIRGALDEGFGMGASSPTQRRVADFGDLTGAPVYEETTPNVNPLVARNVYKRELERAAMNAPIAQEEMRQRGQLQKAQIDAQAGVDAQRTAGEYGVAQERVRQGPQHEYNELQRMLYAPRPNADGTMGAAPGLPPGTTLSRNSMRQAPQPNQSAQLNMLARIRGELANESGGAPVYMNFTNPGRYQAMYNQQAAQLIAASPIDPSAKQVINEYMRDPQNSQLPLDQLFDVKQLTPQEHAYLVNLFTQLRGF